MAEIILPASVVDELKYHGPHPRAPEQPCHSEYPQQCPGASCQPPYITSSCWCMVVRQSRSWPAVEPIIILWAPVALNMGHPSQGCWHSLAGSWSELWCQVPQLGGVQHGLAALVNISAKLKLFIKVFDLDQIMIQYWIGTWQQPRQSFHLV